MAKNEQSGWEPREVTVRHGMFWYFSREKQVLPDAGKGNRLTEQTVLIQRVANQNDKITIELESDYQRGVEHHAFWTDEELKAARTGGAPAIVPEGAAGTVDGPPPALSQAPGKDAGNSDDGGVAEPPDPTEVNVAELDNDELVEWLQGSGMFDGARKPNADEVIDKIGDDPELAERMLAAEKRAQDKPRTSVEKHVNKVQEAATANS